MKNFKRIMAYLSCAAMVASSFTGVSAANTVYVSPGDSIQAAIDGAADGAVIVLEGGTYNESVNITKNNLTIKAKRGEEVVFSASETAKTEEASDEEKSRLFIPKARDNVAAVRGIKNLGEMKNGGIYPVALQNNEYLPIASMQASDKPLRGFETYDKLKQLEPADITINGSEPNGDGTVNLTLSRNNDIPDEYSRKITDNKYLAAADIYMHFMFFDEEYMAPVKFSDSEKTATITAITENGDLYFYSGDYGYYVNDAAFIDEPGEWYADRVAGTILLYPKDKNADVEFIADDKTYITGDKISNLKISGIKFADTLGSAISIKNSENINISGCGFENTSDTAVALEKCNESEIYNCDFSNLGGGAVKIEGTMNTVDNCGFSKIGCLFWTNHEPINVIGSKNTISHNKIEGAPQYAVVLDGDENTVELNDISGVLDQMGGSVVLVCADTASNVIKSNYIHDVFDINKDKIVIQGTNTETIIPEKYGRRRDKDYAIGLCGTSNNEIVNNYISDVTVGVKFEIAKNNNISNNLLFSEGLTFSEIYEFYTYDGNERVKETVCSEGNTINNIFQRSQFKYIDYVNPDFEKNNTVGSFGTIAERDAISPELELDETAIKKKLPEFEMFSLKDVGRYEAAEEPEAEENNTVTLLIGSKKIGANGKITENDVEPMIIGGRTLVPVRCISESFGEDVSWNPDTKTVSVGDNISIVIGEKYITAGGTAKEIDVPAEIYDSRTYVPLRAIAEALGKAVTWDERGLIVITDSETEFSENDLSDMIQKLKS